MDWNTGKNGFISTLLWTCRRVRQVRKLNLRIVLFLDQYINTTVRSHRESWIGNHGIHYTIIDYWTCTTYCSIDRLTYCWSSIVLQQLYQKWGIISRKWRSLTRCWSHNNDGVTPLTTLTTIPFFDFHFNQRVVVSCDRRCFQPDSSHVDRQLLLQWIYSSDCKLGRKLVTVHVTRNKEIFFVTFDRLPTFYYHTLLFTLYVRQSTNQRKEEE